VLGGVLADLKDTIHAWDIAKRRLDKPLLIVIDEAAHLQLGWLPTEVSTIAALGAFFVTCWQNLAQINHRYDRLADAVLSGHRTKCFFAGIDDLTTLKYLTTMLGHEEVTRRGWSNDIPTMWGNRQGGRRSVSESTQREEFAPAHTLREMIPGDAVLLHGTLPPIHLTAVRHWEEPELVRLVGESSSTSEATCPLTSDPVEPGPHAAVDIATLEAAKAQLPKPHRAPGSAPDDPAQPPAGDDVGAQVVDDPGECVACGEALESGGWTPHNGPAGGRRCAPNCHDRHEHRLLASASGA
jgi:type IV secretory pathway TraG/TraD family ATPase VirD4